MKIPEFYEYLRRREDVRRTRLSGQPWPWTDDLILRKYRFTNVKRLHDRTTQMLLKHLYAPNAEKATARQMLLNATIARYVGTWEFATTFGWQDDWDDLRAAHLRSLAEVRMASGEPTFTSAYVISNMGQQRPKIDLVGEYIWTLWDAVDPVIAAIQENNCWEQGIKKFQTLRGFGGSGFMAKEILLDTMLIPDIVWVGDGPSDRNTWCPAGPGAQRGICHILDMPAMPLAQSKCLPVMLEIFGERATHWTPHYPDMELELHDIQFGLCEFDKYERARLHQGKPKRTYPRPRS